MSEIGEKNVQIEEDKKLLDLYTLAEIAYKKHFRNIVDNINELYPEGWYEIKNYKEKMEIIAEAIETNTLIVNTSKYQNIIECVKNKKYML